MQGDELKAMGLTQGQLADQLDLPRVFVGLMERDAKPIDRRTELAVRWLHRHSPDRHLHPV